MVEAVKELLPRAELHAQSPACRTRVAVMFWLRHGFIADPSIFKCTLPEVGAAVGRSAVELHFNFSHKHSAELQKRHVGRVCAKHGLAL